MIAPFRPALLALALLALGGCSIHVKGSDGADGRDGFLAGVERDNRIAIETLELGMSLGEVRSAMPHESDFSEAATVDGVSYRALFYRTHPVEEDGLASREGTTPLVFRNARLVGCGESAWFDATGRSLSTEN